MAFDESEKRSIRKTFEFIREAKSDKRNLDKDGKYKPKQREAISAFLSALRTHDSAKVRKAIDRVNVVIEY